MKNKTDHLIMKNLNWKKFTFEFLSIFFAVISAFVLNNWNDNRRDHRSESKILMEISNGLDKDLNDISSNLVGHKHGIEACQFWRDLFTDGKPDFDTLTQYYYTLTRDFISIQNTSGYETLKSKGFELIENDSLRTKIISLYEYDYQILRKLEEEYSELQLHDNYFNEINRFIAPNFQFDSIGNINGLELPIKLSKSDRNILLSYLWKIQFNREFILKYYTLVEEKIKLLKKEIEKELE